MGIDSIRIPKKRGKAVKLAAEGTMEEKTTGKQYRYKPRGTRTSQLVNKAIPNSSPMSH